MLLTYHEKVRYARYEERFIAAMLTRKLITASIAATILLGSLSSVTFAQNINVLDDTLCLEDQLTQTPKVKQIKQINPENESPKLKDSIKKLYNANDKDKTFKNKKKKYCDIFMRSERRLEKYNKYKNLLNSVTARLKNQGYDVTAIEGKIVSLNEQHAQLGQKYRAFRHAIANHINETATYAKPTMKSDRKDIFSRESALRTELKKIAKDIIALRKSPLPPPTNAPTAVPTETHLEE